MSGASKKRADGGGDANTDSAPTPFMGVTQEERERDLSHPHIVKFMRPWLEKFGSPLKFGQILENGGLTYNDLSVGSFSLNDGSPCWNFLLDKCNFRNCKKPHVVGACLPQGYPQKLCTVIKPAMQVCYPKFAKEQWRSKPGSDAYKRQCH